MKKIIIFLCVVLIFAVFAGCNAANQGDTSSAAPNESAADAGENPSADESVPDIDISGAESDSNPGNEMSPDSGNTSLPTDPSDDNSYSETSGPEPEASEPEVSEPAEHTHSYVAVWSFDEIEHWKECECGDKSDVAEHNYISVVTQPTSTAQGYTTHTCSECNRSYTDSYVDSLASYSEGLEYEVNLDGTTCTITGIGTCKDAELCIPPVIDGYTVTAIGDGAFERCEFLISVDIPNSITSIGANAFYVCEGIVNVTVGKNVVTIGDNAFYYCTKLENITLGSKVEYIGSGAFNCCIKLKSISLPESVKTIGIGAFISCAFSSIYIPEGVTSIENSTFTFCSELSSVTIAGDITHIGEWAFYSCKQLKEIVLPDSVTSIGEWAFECCYELSSITIPESVICIERYAFSNCPKLTSVVFEDASGWYVAQNKGEASGTDVDVFDSSVVAEYFKGEHVGKYWYKK